MATHELHPTRASLHGRFSNDLPPALTVASGDSIVASTLDADWALVEQSDPFGPPAKFEPLTEDDKAGHSLLGPIAVEGAEPGDALEIQLHTIRPSTRGWVCAGGWPSEFNKRLGLDTAEHFRSQWHIDTDAGTATNAKGQTLSLWPFLGWIGLMPAEKGMHSTTPPRRVGGNLDCRELVAGTSLFLPVEVAGGLLSFGDGHAVQGDGEVAGPALECPTERVEMTLVVHKAAAPNLPYANTPAGWVTLGFGKALDDAMYAALNGMVDRLASALSVSRAEALALCSMKASLRVTQIVNQAKGVHALLPTEALRELGL
ncbi:acetamidase [bacterium]|nr:MAG: acetamidase [bacterium]